MTLATPTVPDMSKIKPHNRSAAWLKSVAEDRAKMYSLKKRAEEFQSRVADEIVLRKYGGQIEADFAIFPTIEMKRVFTTVFQNSRTGF